VRCLLDTHIAIWAVTDDARLPKAACDILLDEDATKFVSAASIWEIAIKTALRRGHADDMRMSSREAMNDFVAAGFELLSITPEHTATVEDLPLIHGDPFDRLLVAQSIYEPMRLVTHDARLAEYGSHIILV
jgi:PIN domain nuclease of toxin-antitoxin system